MIHLCLRNKIFIHHEKVESFQKISMLLILKALGLDLRQVDHWVEFSSLERTSQFVLKGKFSPIFQRFSSLFREIAIFCFILFIRFLHVIVLLEIIITFYAFHNFPFPAISRFSRIWIFLIFLASYFALWNANEMKILRKINFFYANFFPFQLSEGKKKTVSLSHLLLFRVVTMLFGV